MSDAVVDTNVLKTANEKSEDRLDCAAACAEAISALAAEGRVVIDDGWEILNEYSRHVSSTGQPGPGDAFLGWLLRNQANAEVCLQLHLTPSGVRGYEEFPDCEGLEAFDSNDRKFVAAASAAEPNAEILVALDRGWWNHRAALSSCGVRVRYLCPTLLQAIAEGRR